MPDLPAQPTHSEATAAYLTAAQNRALAAVAGGGSLIEAPGLVGLRRPDGRIGVSVEDDRCVDTLTELLADEPKGVVTILAAAERARDLFTGREGWRHGPMLMAMVCRDLATVPYAPLDPDLALRPISFDDPHDDSSAASLLAAAAVAVAGDPSLATDTAEGLAAYLRRILPHPELLAAVDPAGQVVATSGHRVTGTDAGVFFVNTRIEWRRRGVGTAMTAAALHAARGAGAITASLDATPAGAPIYARLGFEDAGQVVQFSTRG